MSEKVCEENCATENKCAKKCEENCEANCATENKCEEKCEENCEANCATENKCEEKCATENKCAEKCEENCEANCATENKCAEKCEEKCATENKCAKKCEENCEANCATENKCAEKCEENKCAKKCEDKYEEKVVLSKPCTLSINPKLLKTVDIPNPNIEISEKVFNVVVDKMKGKPISQMNIVEVVAYTMRTVENIKRGKDTLNNNEKKSIVMNIIQRFVQESSMDAEVKVYLTDIFIPTLLEGVIESLCALDVHEITTSCFPCLKKK